MLRITSGKYRGRVIDSPKNKAVRPTTSMVRESLFSILQGELPDARFLDLFSGSGLMGVEALSRGAQFVLAVEQQRDHVRLIQGNYQKLSISPKDAKVVSMDAFQLIGRPNKEAPFDIVFADPPYGIPKINDLMADIEKNGWVSPTGTIILENASRENPPEGFTPRTFGNTTLFFKYLTE